jgi:hypothetical protein
MTFASDWPKKGQKNHADGIPKLGNTCLQELHFFANRLRNDAKYLGSVAIAGGVPIVFRGR